MRFDFTPRRFFDLTPEQVAKLTDDFQDLQKAVTEINKSLVDKDLSNSLASMSTNIEDITKNLKKGTDTTKELNSALKKSRQEDKKLSLEQTRIQSQLVDIEKELLKNLNKTDKRRLEGQKKTLENKSLDNLLQQELNEKVREHLTTLETINNEEKKITEEKKKQNDLGKVFKKSLEDAFKPFTDLATKAGIFKAIVDAALRLSKVSVEIGKNLGYGADNANRVTSNLVKVTQSSTNLNITLANAGEAMAQISESTGYVAEYSADALETQIMLTKQFGLTGEEAAGIYKYSVLTGKSSKAVNDAMVGAFAATRNQLKAGIPFKATMAEAAKVSGVLASNLQNNPKRIVEAVVQAKALGTSLEQAARQGEALLNFESSLENELKAELLTGKQLNLERARAAALMGDQVTVAEELVKNVGSIEEFDRMNVLQKKAIAEAVGLTADELANQLRNQKIALENGKSLAEVTADELKQAEERQNIQDRFNQAILKLQDTIGNLVAGPFGALIDMLSYALNIVGLIGKPFAFLSNLIDQITGKTSGLASILKSVLAIAAGIALFINPVGALASLALSGAMIAGVEAFSDQKFAKGGIVTSEINNATVGEAGPEAIIPLNSPKANDILGINNKEMSGGSIDLTPMIAAINEVKIAVNQLMNRPVIINMDSKQVGSSLVQASPKSA